MSSGFSPVLLKQFDDLSWLPETGTLQVFAGLLPEDAGPVTSSFVFATVDGRWLLTRVHTRGWDVPGGHVEPGESPEFAADRELVEETMWQAASLVPVGFHAISADGPSPDGWRYPWPCSSQAFFLGTDLTELSGNLASDAAEASWFSADEVRELCAGRPWLPLWEFVVDQQS